MGKGLRVVLTDELWRARFNADSGIVGQNVSLNGYDTMVIGVLPPRFYFPKQNQVFGEQAAKRDFRIEYFLNLNLGSWDRRPGVGNFNYAAIGRVRGGVRTAIALAELEAIENGISRQSSSGAILHAELVPFHAGVVGAAAERNLGARECTVRPRAEARRTQPRRGGTQRPLQATFPESHCRYQ